jgi:hypothetical protein
MFPEHLKNSIIIFSASKHIFIIPKIIFSASKHIFIIPEFGTKKFVPSVVSCSSPVVVHMMVLEAYMVVNFKACGISRGARKLIRTPTLN